MQNLKSDCCNADVTVEGEKKDVATHYYLCSKCKKACLPNNRFVVFVCKACGKYKRFRDGFSDVSCAMNAVACYEDSLKFREDGDGKKVVDSAEFAKGVKDESLV